MSTLFKQENGLLGNVGQVWNFFHLLGCNTIAIHGANLNSQGTVIAQLPTSRYVRYTTFNKDQLEYIENQLRGCYNSSTKNENALPALVKHFNLEVDIKSVVSLRCGDGIVGGGFAVIMRHFEPSTLTAEYYCIEYLARRPGVL